MNPTCCAGDCNRGADLIYGRLAICGFHHDVLITGLAYTEARQSMYFVRTWRSDQREDQTETLQRDMSVMLDKYTADLEEREANHNAALVAAGDMESEE